MFPLEFLALTFAISLAAFFCILRVPAARSPEVPTGLPFWLMMVWGPSLAAILLSWRENTLWTLLNRVVMVSSVPVSAWCLVIAPLLILVVIRPKAPDATTPLGLKLFLAMVTLNLILGPLGEELGWRGYLQDGLTLHVGWLEASLLVGLIWLIWHLPLWMIDSPHSKIALPLFAAHVMCYTVIIGAIYALSGGSIFSAIMAHLTVNLASNLAVFAGFQEPNAWFRASLPSFVVLSLVSIGLVVAETGQTGLSSFGL